MATRRIIRQTDSSQRLEPADFYVKLELEEKIGDAHPLPNHLVLLIFDILSELKSPVECENDPENHHTAAVSEPEINFIGYCSPGSLICSRCLSYGVCRVPYTPVNFTGVK
ncbi:unnamed protein product [Pieris macdunnoughi]|uniref:Uncharacterized protein n=1 Tax=Pieris macdunnoughi TaxID=345717 RepID=A0A821PTR7_9NEOP|nr:unnamed protein product [Pieris macdunnoughi]